MFARVVGPGAGHAALDLVGDEHHSVGGAPLLERDEVSVGGHHETALALDRLDDQAGEIGCADDLLEVSDRARSGLGPAQSVAIGVGARRVVDVAGQRPEAGGVRHGLVVHGHGEVGAAVIGVVEDRHRSPAGVLAGDLHAVLHRLGSRVHEHRLLGVVARGVLREKLRHAHVLLVRRDGEERVDDVLKLSGGGLDDRSLRVADRRDADPRAEVHELVAVDVDQDRAVGLGDVDGKRRGDAGRDHG